MKTAQSPLNIGADVAKDEIVVACAEQSFAPRKIANTRSALLTWLKTLPTGSRISMESTGSYHELLAELAHTLGFVVYVLNPKDVRHYAKSVALPFGSADAFVAFCGWDPRPDDSGRKSGRRRLSKRGSSQLRYLLYNAAMAASRTRAWRPLYERALAKRLSRVEALVILARQIARTAWSIHTHKTDFDPQRIAQPLT